MNIWKSIKDYMGWERRDAPDPKFVTYAERFYRNCQLRHEFGWLPIYPTTTKNEK